jgi:alpha-tubulin suppressor-like RCC1 family protein
MLATGSKVSRRAARITQEFSMPRNSVDFYASARTGIALLVAALFAVTACQDDSSSLTEPGSLNTEVAANVGAAAAGALSFMQVSAGGSHTCGLTNDGLAYCWGNNDLGQLGDGTHTTPRLKPTAVAGGLHFVQISAGDQHTCAVTAANQAYCWGDNHQGQLGDGTFDNRSLPTLVRGKHQFRQIRAGFLYTCAVNVNDVAFCWGDNQFGMLGTGGTLTLVPVQVAGGLHWRQVIAGASHTCGVTTNDKGYCWGANNFGELGDGTSTQHSKPTAIAGGLAFREVQPGGGFYIDFAGEPEAEDGHSCGVTTDNKAYCWGLNESGVLGTGSPDNSRTPAKVTGGRRFRFVNTGVLHACGVTLANAVFCWGGNQYGQLGDGSSMDFQPRLSPVRVAGNLSFSSVSAFTLGNHSCGWTTTDGHAYCWGINDFGQLGDGSRTNRPTPVAVVAP